MPANLENTAVATLSIGKGQFSFQSQRKAIPKRMFKVLQIALISHAGQVMLKILQARLQHYVNYEPPDVQAGFRKGRTKDLLPTSVGSVKKQESSKKHLLLLIDYAKAYDCVDHNKLKNSSRDGNTRSPYLPSAKGVCRSRNNS